MADSHFDTSLVICKNKKLMTTSLVIAEVFGKEHRNILMSIDNLECSQQFRELNFKLSSYVTKQNRAMPCYEISRDGFSFLVMGFTGKEAAQWKEKFISAFNYMEQQIRKNIVQTESVIDKCLMMLTENQVALQHAVSTGFGAVNARIDVVDNKVDRLNYAVTEMAVEVHQLSSRGRRRIKDSVKAEIARHTRELGGQCPCCGTAAVVDEQGAVSRFAEYDHFYQNSQADSDHVWLICKPCHAELTNGRATRGDRQDEFNAFQKKRRRLPGLQPIFEFEVAA